LRATKLSLETYEVKCRTIVPISQWDLLTSRDIIEFCHDVHKINGEDWKVFSTSQKWSYRDMFLEFQKYNWDDPLVRKYYSSVLLSAIEWLSAKKVSNV
jgi:hypothetical protein